MEKLQSEEIDWFLKSEISSDLEVRYCCSDDDDNGVKNENDRNSDDTNSNLNINPQNISDFLGNIDNAISFECDDITNYIGDVVIIIDGTNTCIFIFSNDKYQT